MPVHAISERLAQRDVFCCDATTGGASGGGVSMADVDLVTCRECLEVVQRGALRMAADKQPCPASGMPASGLTGAGELAQMAAALREACDLVDSLAAIFETGQAALVALADSHRRQAAATASLARSSRRSATTPRGARARTADEPRLLTPVAECGARPAGGDGTSWCVLARRHGGDFHEDQDGRAFSRRARSRVVK